MVHAWEIGSTYMVGRKYMTWHISGTTRIQSAYMADTWHMAHSTKRMHGTWHISGAKKAHNYMADPSQIAHGACPWHITHHTSHYAYTTYHISYHTSHITHHTPHTTSTYLSP